VKPRLEPLVDLSALARRDGFLCGICGQPVDLAVVYPDPLFVTVDHVVPLSRGGAPLDPDNCRVAHFVCNVTRGDGGL
jgi:5-methylcytosine-specific restriction endonuclease McrA